MSDKNQIIQIAEVQNRICNIKDLQVIVDRDLADIYHVETRVLNQAVKRNIRRFPSSFMFQLTKEEYDDWSKSVLKSQIVISKEKFEQLFKALEDKSLKPKQSIFYDGQVFDAYVFIADLIKTAKSSIVLIDNYVDESILQLFSKRNKKATLTIYTKNISKVLVQDVEKYKAQYLPITLKAFDKAHDHFLIIDQTTVYHFGASLKDLGKKWFAFSKFDKTAMEILDNLKEA